MEKSKQRIALVIPYFGKFHNYIDLFWALSNGIPQLTFLYLQMMWKTFPVMRRIS